MFVLIYSPESGAGHWAPQMMWLLQVDRLEVEHKRPRGIQGDSELWAWALGRLAVLLPLLGRTERGRWEGQRHSRL